MRKVFSVEARIGPRSRRAAAGALLTFAVSVLLGCPASKSEQPSTTLYDALTGQTLDGTRWQTPEYVRTTSGGQAVLSARSSRMESNLVRGRSYLSSADVANPGGGRVTTLRANVSVPRVSASRSGTGTQFTAGIRLDYQPASARGFSAPGANQDQLITALELVDTGGGLKIRRRICACLDPACINLGTATSTFTVPAGFGVNGCNLFANAEYDTTYTFTLSMLDEVNGVFRWAVQGGAFTTEVAGTAALQNPGGMAFESVDNGFLSAQLRARVADTSPGGGGSAAVAAAFDGVWVGTNGAAATLYDDFSGTGSSADGGFSLDRWRAGANAEVDPGADGVHLRATATSTAAVRDVNQSTPLAAAYPARFGRWQADVGIVGQRLDGASTGAVQVGGLFFNDGTAGGTSDATGDVLAYVSLATHAASVVIARCQDAACKMTSPLQGATLPASASHPLGLGTIHTVGVQWDAATHTFTFQLDDAAPVKVVYSATPAPIAAWVPTRWIRSRVAITSASPAGTTASIDALVKNVHATP
jgi:hypothetical protein